MMSGAMCRTEDGDFAFTPEERREVAERLRSGLVAGNIPEAYTALVQAVGVRPCLLSHDGESGDRFDREAYDSALARLADLIDPTTTADVDRPWRVCRTCNGKFAGYNIKPVRFCPHCGARLVEA